MVYLLLFLLQIFSSGCSFNPALFDIVSPKDRGTIIRLVTPPPNVIAIYAQDTSPRHYGSNYFCIDTPGPDDDTAIIYDRTGQELARGQTRDDFVTWERNYDIPIFRQEWITFKQAARANQSCSSLKNRLILHLLDDSGKFVREISWKDGEKRYAMPGPLGHSKKEDYLVCEYDEIFEQDGYIRFPEGATAWEYNELIVRTTKGWGDGQNLCTLDIYK